MTTQPFPSPYHLHPRAERAVKRGHPWVYAEGIRRLRHGGQPGVLAVMFDRRDRFLASACTIQRPPSGFGSCLGSPRKIDDERLLGRLQAALERREGQFVNPNGLHPRQTPSNGADNAESPRITGNWNAVLPRP
jgi:23S rRNA G2069 N7-methylase RlmK/C1962 C5-methylase RlmI